MITDSLKRAFGHFKTITKHRHKVIQNCARAGILWQGLFHDLSKYSPTEFLVGVRLYQDGKRSPNEAERYEKGYSSAWLHHKGRNKHHFEYWNDYSPVAGKVVPIPMPIPYLKELLCDRIAASMIYKGKDYDNSYPLAYYLKGDVNRFIAKETSDFIIEYLTILAEDGEDAMFQKLRKLK